MFLFFAAVPALPAVEYRRSGLLDRTPFSKDTRGVATAGAGGPYELRGFFGAGETLEVSVRRTDSGEAHWVPVGVDTGKWRIESADAEQGTALLLADGMRFDLRLAKAFYSEASAVVPEPPKRTDRPGARLIDVRSVEALAAAREEGLSRLRGEHPEYFIEPNRMTDDQRRVAAAAIEAVNRRVNATLEDSPPANR